MEHFGDKTITGVLITKSIVKSIHLFAANAGVSLAQRNGFVCVYGIDMVVS